MKKSQTKTEIIETEVIEAAVTRTHQDIVLSILIVSLVANLFVLTAWIALKVTTAYDSEVATFLFSR